MEFKPIAKEILKDDYKLQLLNSSILSFFLGFGLDKITYFFGNDITTYDNILKWLGIWGVGYYFLTWSKFDRIFRALDLGTNHVYPLLKSKKKTDCSTIYKFTLPAGLSSEDFKKSQQAIEEHLGKNIDIKYTYKEIQIEVFNEKPKRHYDYILTELKGDVPILIGYDKKGELIECDLSSGDPHMLIAGSSGSGKSTTLRSIITNLILTSNVQLHLIDLKNGAEFNIFRKSSKVINFGRKSSDAMDILGKLDKEIDIRYDLFYDNDVKDIKEYNKKFPHEKLDYHLLIIDEFADLQYVTGAMPIIQTIGRKARACGIHMILATQRPDSKVLDGGIKANVATILGLKTSNHVNSNIIIDEPGLEKLFGKGHGWFKREGKIIEVQTPYLETDKARELIQHTYIDKKYENKKVVVNDDLVVEAINNL